ncbi:ABC transporter substrate-binding protein [Fundidesulfovibrio agrisoli]|uniref:ABC transporter substrate-binding protein n=1 Tax=Fundidesulfovibrio agrisoli TaxID=2922717 RepID=UPI001FAB8898|nr:ABC transporter substrate-binding protein [Fundidesulfovibrio agrisoli]
MDIAASSSDSHSGFPGAIPARTRRSSLARWGASPGAGLSALILRAVMVIAVLFASLPLQASPLLAAEPSNSPPGLLTDVRLQLKWKHQFQFAGYYAAVTKGFFAKEGLNVQLVEGVPGLTPSERLFTGQADYAVDSTAILLLRQKGVKVVALAAIFQHSPNILLTRRDSGLTTPQSLAGKRIMFTDPTDPECRAMLANEGVYAKDYITVPHTWSIDPLINGTVDAMSAYITNEPYTMERRGVTPGIIVPNQYAVDFYGDCLTTSEEEIAQHPRRVEAFLRAVSEGWRYAMDHPEEMVDVILKNYPTQRTRDELLYEAAAMRDLIQPELVEVGHMNPARWQHIAQTYERLGLLAPGFSLEGWLYPELKQAQSDRERRQVRDMLTIGVAVFLAGCMVGGTLLVFNKRLSRMVRERTRALEQSRDFFLAVINAMKDPVFVKDASLRYILLNNACAELAGGKPEDFIGKTDEGLFPEDVALAYGNEDRAVLREGNAPVRQETITDARGAPHTLLTQKTRYTDSAGQEFIVGSLRDITEFKRMQDVVVQAEKMMSLGVLAAGMAHEINNPLGIIMQSSQNLQRRLFEGLTANKAAAAELGLDFEAMSAYMKRRGILESVEHIREACGRAGTIVRNMLEFSRKSEEDHSLCGLPAIVDNVLDMISNDYDLKKRYDFRKIKLEKSYAPDCTPVLCSPTKIGQVILNILLNAMQAMTSGGQSPEEPTLSIQVRPDGDRMRIALQDNGPGMDAEVRKRIFEPFFTTKDPGKGTGLGMFVSYNIITEMHGGQLLVDSSPGKGTTFTILLPMPSPGGHPEAGAEA